MENLNEGKKKKMSYMAELAEIDKQSAIVAMEAKIDKLAEMIEAKTTRLSMVSEDENLSELIDKKRVKDMQKEIKILEKEKSKMEKMYEKMGAKKKEIVDEEKKDDEMNEGGYGMSSYEEDDDKPSMEEEIDEAHCTTEEDDVNEEVNRWQKLAGVYLNENKILNEEDITDENLANLMKTRGTADVSLWHITKLIKAGIIQDSEKEKALKAVDYDF